MAQALDDLSATMNSLIIDDYGTITLSQKNHLQLFFNGYYFRKVPGTNSLISKWRCTRTACNARCQTNGNSVGERYFVRFDDSVQHNHSSDPIKFAKMEKRRKMKEIAKNSDEAPRRIISKCVDELTLEEEIAQSSSNDADRQFISRVKKQVKPDFLQVPSPVSLSDINFPEELLKTLTGENFLLYDSGKDDPERIFIFGTLANLKLIENSHFYADGTFDVSPDLFYQIYSLHVLIESKCYPVIFVFLPKKTQKIYEKFLTFIESMLDSHPISINVDYEKAMINASLKIFPKIKVYGCFFHFNQSLWRNIQKNDLEGAYNLTKSLVDYRKLLKVVVVLSYIPPSDVPEIFEKYKNSLVLEDPIQVKILAFYEYFEEFYIGKKIKERIGRGKNAKIVESRAKPLFDIALWNIHSRLLDNLPRTTNFVESWHNSFCNMIVSHPCVYDLVNWLRKEQKRSNDSLVKLKTGVVNKRNTEQEYLDTRIRELLKKYSKIQFEDFFQSLSLIVKY